MGGYKQEQSCPDVGQGFFVVPGGLMKNDSFSFLQGIKEHPVRSFGQLIKVLLLIIVTVLSFLIGAGAPLLIIIYLAAVVVTALYKGDFMQEWKGYVLAAAAGAGVIWLLSVIFGGLLAAFRENLLVSAFGKPADENEGGKVPSFCEKPFDPKETALLELERKYNANLLSREEYERQKKDIFEKNDNSIK